MTKPINTAAFQAATGRSWPEWLAFLEKIGARDLPHKDIARRVEQTGAANSWWAQGITVAYEQHIGRRVPGQRGDGAFEISVSRTLPTTPDAVLALWSKTADGLEDADGVPFDGPPETSASEKWRYWRRALADGARLLVTIGDRPGGKAGIALTHQKIAPAEADRWRDYWKSRLKTLA